MMLRLRLSLVAALVASSVFMIDGNQAEAQACRHRRVSRPYPPSTAYAPRGRACVPQHVPVRPVPPLAAPSPGYALPNGLSDASPSGFSASYQRVSVTVVIETLQLGSAVAYPPPPPALSGTGEFGQETTVCQFGNAPLMDVEPEDLVAPEGLQSDGMPEPDSYVDFDPELLLVPFSAAP